MSLFDQNIEVKYCGELLCGASVSLGFRLKKSDFEKFSPELTSDEFSIQHEFVDRGEAFIMAEQIFVTSSSGEFVFPYPDYTHIHLDRTKLIDSKYANTSIINDNQLREKLFQEEYDTRAELIREYGLHFVRKLAIEKIYDKEEMELRWDNMPGYKSVVKLSVLGHSETMGMCSIEEEKEFVNISFLRLSRLDYKGKNITFSVELFDDDDEVQAWGLAVLEI